MPDEKTGKVVQLSPLERPRSSPSAAPGAFQSIELPLLDRFGTHPGYGLTPRKVIDVFRQAERGWPQQQCDLFEDVIENDGHLRACYETQLDAVVGKSWTVQAGGDDPADATAARLLDEALRLMPNFSQTIEHQLTEDMFGYAGSEIVWDRVVMKTGTVTAPAWFANVPHRRFTFDANDRPRLITKMADFQGEPLTDGKWWFSRRRGRIAAAAGLMRTATWWALFKRLSVRDWVIFAERFGLPLAIGKYNDSMTEEEKLKLRQAVASIGKDGFAVFHEDGNIEFPQVERGGKSDDVHGALVALCNAEISKLITGATLTADGGSGVGSYAQANVHEGVKFERVLARAERLSVGFERAVGLPFVTFNGMAARPPRLKIHIVRDVDPKVMMELYCRAANEVGLKIDEDEFRQRFQMKAPTGTFLVGSNNTAPSDGSTEKKGSDEPEPKESEEPS